MLLTLQTCEVRSWRLSDVPSLVAHANNQRIAINLRDQFPHPYTTRDARSFIRDAREMRPETRFAIAVGQDAVGGIGFNQQEDIERVSAEIGYWLGEPFWGRGIATDALVAVTRYAVECHHLTRVFAVTFESNLASCRVLEKAGYALEGRLRRSAIKNGIVLDQLQYAFVVP